MTPRAAGRDVDLSAFTLIFGSNSAFSMYAMSNLIALQISLACLLNPQCYKNYMKAYILQLKTSGDENKLLSRNDIHSIVPRLKIRRISNET